MPPIYDPEIPERKDERPHNPIVVVIAVVSAAVVCCVPMVIWYVMRIR